MSGAELAPRRHGAEARLARLDGAGVREVLAVGLAAELYALPLSAVREILRVPAVTFVPRAPSDVLGIMSVRGQVTTLIDLRLRLALPCAPLDSKARVLLVEREGETVGLLCDRVLGVHRLLEQEVELASVLGAPMSSYVVGIGRPGSAAQQRAGARTGHTAQEDSASDPPLLILLDPNAVLKRLGHG